MEPVAVLIYVTDISSALEWCSKAFPSSRVLISELNELAVICQVEDPDGNLIGLRGRTNSTKQIDA